MDELIDWPDGLVIEREVQDVLADKRGTDVGDIPHVVHDVLEIRVCAVVLVIGSAVRDQGRRPQRPPRLGQDLSSWRRLQLPTVK